MSRRSRSCRNRQDFDPVHKGQKTTTVPSAEIPASTAPVATTPCTKGAAKPTSTVVVPESPAKTEPCVTTITQEPPKATTTTTTTTAAPKTTDSYIKKQVDESSDSLY
ncbi:hypothetical protein AMAG_05987 [Allomyces macrogynus ATCC 38327]|uniref:Uncharacterized protein n=1 Tax=Allomyces macrogynus (strain ATCC 38327) TaxID=578462 RepID=A0A0L0SDH7_ALLM3|nr:hypothetical protein AMAG_05987 [Allomyces macrogynus ATCC 38327]|eukprot:KNE60608.1 hypothetical protein AMAG_05987 [Allomyces macrogynus ATCC 38327]